MNKVGTLSKADEARYKELDKEIQRLAKTIEPLQREHGLLYYKMRPTERLARKVVSKVPKEYRCPLCKEMGGDVSRSHRRELIGHIMRSHNEIEANEFVYHLEE